MQAMILAAGFGTRLRPHSLVRPKPLFPVMGRPLILHLIDRLRGAGFDRILVNCHHLAARFHQLLDTEPGVFLQDEEIELGTGGGLRRARGWFEDQPVLVMNGDIFHDYDPATIFRSHLRSGARLSLLLHDLPRFNNVLVGADGRITAFRVGRPRSDLRAYTGIQVLDPGLLEAIPVDTFYDLIDCYQGFLATGEIRALMDESPSYWRDMGTEADYLTLHRDIFQGRSLRLSPGSSFFIDPSARVDSGAGFADWAVVGAGAEIGPGCRITRTVIWDGARVAAGSIITDQVVTG